MKAPCSRSTTAVDQKLQTQFANDQKLGVHGSGPRCRYGTPEKLDRSKRWGLSDQAWKWNALIVHKNCESSNIAFDPFKCKYAEHLCFCMHILVCPDTHYSACMLMYYVLWFQSQEKECFIFICQGLQEMTWWFVYLETFALNLFFFNV